MKAKELKLLECMTVRRLNSGRAKVLPRNSSVLKKKRNYVFYSAYWNTCILMIIHDTLSTSYVSKNRLIITCQLFPLMTFSNFKLSQIKLSAPCLFCIDVLSDLRLTALQPLLLEF